MSDATIVYSVDADLHALLVRGALTGACLVGTVAFLRGSRAALAAVALGLILIVAVWTVEWWPDLGWDTLWVALLWLAPSLAAAALGGALARWRRAPR